MKKKRMILVGSILIALLFITVGVTYAFYTYQGQGQRENMVKTGNLTFVYDEKRIEGNQVTLTNAFPMTDEQGKAQTGNNNVFEFQITATTKGAPISYEIYLTKEESSTLSEQVVKTYLTKVNGEEETAVFDTRNQRDINLYSELGESSLVSQGKTLYQETIPESQANYSQTFRYRMWIDEDASQMQDGEWIYNGQTFSVRVNVYASNEAMRAPLEEVLVYDDTTTKTRVGETRFREKLCISRTSVGECGNRSRKWNEYERILSKCTSRNRDPNGRYQYDVGMGAKV